MIDPVSVLLLGVGFGGLWTSTTIAAVGLVRGRRISRLVGSSLIGVVSAAGPLLVRVAVAASGDPVAIPAAVTFVVMFLGSRWFVFGDQGTSADLPRSPALSTIWLLLLFVIGCLALVALALRRLA